MLIEDVIKEKNIKRLMVVCGKSIEGLEIYDSLRKMDVVFFSDFEPNPHYESVLKGIEVFNRECCDAIFAVGGGSAIDVAKCIKLFCKMDKNIDYQEQEYLDNGVLFVAMPTTAGTGSEATSFAVIYRDGEKISIENKECIPDVVLLDSKVLKTLPLYQRKSTMLDALCHAVESYWSIKSTDESKRLAARTIDLIIKNIDGYLGNTEDGNRCMLEAANIAGKAINITKTTAGHAMCYKITSLFGTSHGHAAALCVKSIWPYMIENIDDCIDIRGSEYLRQTLVELSKLMGGNSIEQGADIFAKIFDGLELEKPVADEKHLEILSDSVNVERLSNHPVKLEYDIIKALYGKILGN